MVVRREERGGCIWLDPKARVAEAPVEEAVNAVAGGWLAAEPACDDVELVLVNEVSDTGEADASYLRRGVEEISGDMFET